MDTVVESHRVRFCETDQQGIAHHSVYLQWFEVARVEWFRAVGLDYRAFEESGRNLVVVEASVRYRKPAYFDDALTMAVGVGELRSASVRLDYEIRRGELLLATGSTRLACLSTAKRPERFPAETRERLEAGLARAAADEDAGHEAGSNGAGRAQDASASTGSTT